MSKKSGPIFTTMQAARIVGVTFSRLDSWDRRGGFFKPSIAEAEGRGSQRLYSLADLIQLSAIKRLRDQGASLQSLRKAKRVMSKLDLNKPWQYVIVEAGDLYVETEKDHVLSLLLQPGQGILQFQIVHLVEVTREVSLAIQLEEIEERFNRQYSREAASA